MSYLTISSRSSLDSRGLDTVLSNCVPEHHSGRNNANVAMFGHTFRKNSVEDGHFSGTFS
jgi:hypothetical protein